MSNVTRTYFMLNVQDMPRAVAFYREVLGPVIRTQTDTWVELKFGDATVALHAGPGGPKHTGLGVEVDDIDASSAAVERMGGRILSVLDGIGGQRTIEVADTEGNTFSLSTNGSLPA